MAYRENLLVDADGFYCATFTSFQQAQDQFVSSVLYNGAVTHHFGDSQKQALEKAKEYVKSHVGEIIDSDKPPAPELIRLVRWEGQPLLVREEKVIHMDNSWVERLAGCNLAQCMGFFHRNVKPQANAKEDETLEEWLNCPQDAWKYIPADAVILMQYPYDFWPDE